MNNYCYFRLSAGRSLGNQLTNVFRGIDGLVAVSRVSPAFQVSINVCPRVADASTDAMAGEDARRGMTADGDR